MTTTADMNIIVGQGTAIKEVYNVKKQNLEMNQHFVAQHAEDQKKEDKSKVQEFDKSAKIEIKSDSDKRDRKKKNSPFGLKITVKRRVRETLRVTIRTPTRILILICSKICDLIAKV